MKTKRTKKTEKTETKATETEKIISEKDAYSATIFVPVLKQKYTNTGATLVEAIGGLDVKNVKGMAILTVTHGNVSKDKILPANNVFRLFSASPLMREIAIKNVCIRFQGI